MDLMEILQTEKKCKIGMKWRIKEDFLKEAMKNIDDDTVNSSWFYSNIPGVKYCLKLASDQNNPNEINIFMSFFIKMLQDTFGAITISVKSASYTKFFGIDWVFSDGWRATLCTRDELFDPEKKFFVDGIMEVELEGTLFARRIKRKACGPSSLGELLFDCDDKDVTIVVGDEQVKIHKLIITANSPVFRAAMESGLKESIENKITIVDFSFEVVNIFVQYCYERDIANLINKENASELLHFADKYNIGSLHYLLQTSLMDELSETNVCEFANMSITSNAHELRECCICVLMELVEKSTVMESFTKLNNEITNEIDRRSLFSSFSE